jgi:cytochrome c peroxidase
MVKLNLKSVIGVGFFITISLSIYSCRKDPPSTASSAMVIQLGQSLFSDKSLSNPSGQSCASCHGAGTGFSDPNHNIVSPGAVDGLFGNRNATSIAYSAYVPSPLHYSAPDSSYVGGFFMDGRANTLEDQAQKPFLNPLEMANDNSAMVFSKLQASPNYGLFKQVYGNVTNPDSALLYMAEALSAFERSPALSPFTSKFDYYLKGQASLTAEELSGMTLFSDTTRANCVNCHLITPDPYTGKILFTDHTYADIGVPKNPNNPYYTIPTAFNSAGTNYIDLGLGAIINDPDYNGTFKVPTLRNIAISAPYFHNGYFNDLQDVVHFYNTRDVAGSGFPAAEYAPNIDSVHTGNLHLTAQEESDIVAFLKTLTDGYQ